MKQKFLTFLLFTLTGFLTAALEHFTGLPRIIPKTPAFRLGMKAISNLKIKKSPVLKGGDLRGLLCRSLLRLTPYALRVYVLPSAVCSMLLWASSFAHADIGDFLSKFQPYITVQEEYNSNINLAPTNRKEDYITTLSPGLRFSTLPRSAITGEFRQVPTAEDKFGMDLDFRAGFVFYAKEEDYNYIGLNGLLNAWYLLSQRLSFRVRDYLIRSDEIREADFSATAIPGQTLISRTITREPYYRNVFEPSVEYRFGRENTIGINYRNNIYEIKSQLFEDSMENYINPRLTYWFNIRNGISLEYGLTFGDFQRSPDLVGHMGMGRYTYRFNPKTSTFVEYAYSIRDFEPPSIDYDICRPSIGLEHAFSPTLSGKIQLGYFWANPEKGSTLDKPYFDIGLTQRAEKANYALSFQGGYTEDYFTAENLGFTQYYRGIGSVNYRLLQRMTVGLFSSYEWAKYYRFLIETRQKDHIWAIGGNTSYQPFRWLTLSLEITHRENHSNVDTADYSEYRGIFRVTATY